MTTFTWRIDPLMVENSVNGLENVVVKITWICDAQDGDFQASASGYVPLEAYLGMPFIPFDELTEATVWEWAEKKIDKRMIEDGLIAVIDAQKHPRYVYLPTPWNQS